MNLILRTYKVAELNPEALSEEFLKWVYFESNKDTGPFVSEYDGLAYLCLESTEGLDIPAFIQDELEDIKEAVGYNLKASNPDYVWVVRIDYPDYVNLNH